MKLYLNKNNIIFSNAAGRLRIMGEYLTFCISHANTSSTLSMDEDDILYLGG